jgi:hypothetical protein
VLAQNSRRSEKGWRFLCHRPTVAGMITILSTVVSVLGFRLRRRTSLELELIALRHQVSVLRRQRPGRLRLFSTDRLLWVVQSRAGAVVVGFRWTLTALSRRRLSPACRNSVSRPRSSNVACGFPALRSPPGFTLGLTTMRQDGHYVLVSGTVGNQASSIAEVC